MAQLIVRKLDARLVGRLKRRAKEHGVSMEEETRRLLREALTPVTKTKPKRTLLEHLAMMPNVGDDRDFDVRRAPPKAKLNFKELLLSVPDFGDDADAYRKGVKWRDINLD